MQPDHMRAVLKVILGLIVVAAALAFSVGLAQPVREIGEFRPVAPSTGIGWFLGAILLFTVVVSVFRLTKVPWFWSTAAGASAIVVYSVAVSLLLQFFFALLEGWIQD